MCVEFSFSEGVYKHRDVGSGVKNEATGSYLLYIHFFCVITMPNHIRIDEV